MHASDNGSLGRTRLDESLPVSDVETTLCDDSYTSRHNAEMKRAPALERRIVRDEVDEQLLPLFLEEANTLYPRITLTLQAWREQSGADIQLGDKLQRILHTLKGSARMAGAMRLGELTHRVEGRIADAIEQSSLDAALWNELDNYLGRIRNSIDKLAGGEVATEFASSVRPLPQQQIQSKSAFLPFGSVSERLYRVVRQTTKELGKKANLELFGTGLEIQRSVLETMTAPFEHLLRNAIAHGIETPEQRKLLGKPEIGEIRLSLQHEGAERVFKFSDDGAGLDLARLQQKAIECGALQQGEVLGTEQAIQMIFKPGLSTASEVTEICGRGIGLDVVRSEIGALGGRMDVVSNQGQGVSFIIRLPLF